MDKELSSLISKYTVAGFCVVVTFFGLFLGWSILSPLDSAAIATGEVGSEGKQKIVQHLEGGIVKKILVKDGDQVRTGQILVSLDDTQAQASLSLIEDRYWSSIALQSRLVAERDDLSEVKYPESLINSGNKNIKAILTAQTNIFSSRRASLEQKKGILAQRIAQSKEEIKGLKNAVHSQYEQLLLAKEEIDAYDYLEQKGMSMGKSRLLAIKKDAARVRGERSKNLAAIVRTEKGIGETELRISTLNAEHLNEVVEQLRTVQTELFDLEDKLRAAKDVLDRTKIRAPIAGTIVGLQIHTETGVVAPGAEVLGIVPSGEQLVVDARINPKDIDVVRPGLPAHVRFTAFNSRNHQPAQAKVIKVSADRFTDDRTGEAFYKATVIVDDVNEALNGKSLYPGMQAEVMILIESRTPMDYLLEPFTQSLNRAFRET
ncbi:HlyD family type I secretion periplasmic adaptor subunit [Neptuniibacter sp. QD48_11]|uniref:HlyD family type I secretion periplasmic adaptor subunit n=1 Tax=Neptuniibacter sp. QD48_11 TaxID=3398211 RepID=UPI0039F47F05